MRAIRRFLVGLFFFVFFCAFLLMGWQNREPVRLTFWPWTTGALPFSYFIFASFLVGFVFALFFLFAEIVRLKFRLRKIRRTQELLERELDALRNQPLFDEPPAPSAPGPGSPSALLSHNGLREQALEDLERD